MKSTSIHFIYTSLVTGCLGAALALLVGSSDAIGYPSGPVVSMGSNPVATYAGVLNQGATEALMSAPSDQDFIITDIVMGVGDTTYTCRSQIRISLSTPGGSLGEFVLGTTSDPRGWGTTEKQLVASLQTGLRVGAGDSLSISTERRYESGCNSAGPILSYVLSGYYASP